MKKKSRGYIFIGVAAIEILTTLLSIFNLHMTKERVDIPERLVRTVTIFGLTASIVVSIVLVSIGLFYLIKYREEES